MDYILLRLIGVKVTIESILDYRKTTAQILSRQRIKLVN